MKTFLLFLLTGFFGIATTAQAPTITGDLLLCPNANGTASITTDMPYDSYQWYWKYWFTSTAFAPISGANGASFTYDWNTYDQALLKVVVTLDGQTYESNTIQIDSYAWVGLTMGYEDTPNVSTDGNGVTWLCAGTGFTLQVYMPYTIVQWYRNNVPIPGATNMELHVTEPGSYYVVAAPAFCPDSTSSTQGLEFNIQIDNNCNLGVDNPEQTLLSFYPNPVAGQLHFSAQTPIESLSVFNLAGQRVWSMKPASLSGNADLSGLASGMYILEARGDGKVQQSKIIKN
jgi:hypothetical protein